MTGRRPAHLSRRGAIYQVRFRLPGDLAARLGVAELRKSVDTADPVMARRRCAEARRWFGELVEQLRANEGLTRADIEEAARVFFERLRDAADQPRDFTDELFDQEISLHVDTHRERMRELEDQLRSNRFEVTVQRSAEELVGLIGATLGELSDHLRLFALQMAARAERQQSAFLVGQLKEPAKTFTPDDDVFLTRARAERKVVSRPVARPTGPTLGDAVRDHLRRKTERGLGHSQIEEVGRALNWLIEVLGDSYALEDITKDRLRRFRDDIQRLDKIKRGRRAPFGERLTSIPGNQIRSVTAARYWSSVAAFFAWCEAEGLSATNPAVGLKVEKRKGEERQSPDPFTDDELRRLFATPLYAGCKSLRSISFPGECRTRGGHWWSGILPMFTGLRAGEWVQLRPGDFRLADEFPHLLIREEDDLGARVKSTKTKSSVRQVPVAPVLLQLGLAEFVAARAKRYPNDRIFREFRLGTKGHKSDGPSRWWGAYLKRFELWSHGRATHQSRHTFIGRLRGLEVPEEVIIALAGHTPANVTASYGGAFPLSRKAEAVAKLQFGFDIVDALGGPYDPKHHRLP